MSTLAETMAQDRRRIILVSLKQASYAQLNETILRAALQNFGHGAGRDVVRNDLTWLEEQRLVRLEKLPELWIAHLTEEGDEVASGRTHHGVARKLD